MPVARHACGIQERGNWAPREDDEDRYNHTALYWPWLPFGAPQDYDNPVLIPPADADSAQWGVSWLLLTICSNAFFLKLQALCA
jgi:hypothetical protein